MRAHSLPARAVATLAALCLAALVTGCSGRGGDNEPDRTPAKERVVRTPSPLGTDLPSSDPPILQRLPGATGGAPGEVPTSAPPASPGQGSGVNEPN